MFACGTSIIYAMYGWIPAIIGLIILIIGVFIPSPAPINTKKRVNNQELEGGRRKK